MSTEKDTTPSASKACTRCGDVKVLDLFGFDKRARDGRQSACRECCNRAGAAKYASDPVRGRERGREHYAANRERIRAAQAARYAANPEPARRSAAAWAAANPERRRAIIAAWHAAHPERRAEIGAVWYRANFERARAKRAAAYRADPARHHASTRAWAEANPDRRRVIKRRWKAANRDRVTDAAALRRARQRSAPVVERISRSVVWERDAGICHLCGEPADPNDWHLEHIVPLARGGEHSYRNVAVSHPACNQKKGAKQLPGRAA